MEWIETGINFQIGKICCFWRSVKGGLSYPLLIELSEEMGLVGPASWMRLPTELKYNCIRFWSTFLWIVLPKWNVLVQNCVLSLQKINCGNSKYEEKFGKTAKSESECECEWKAMFSCMWMRWKRLRNRDYKKRTKGGRPKQANR